MQNVFMTIKNISGHYSAPPLVSTVPMSSLTFIFSLSATSSCVATSVDLLSITINVFMRIFINHIFPGPELPVNVKTRGQVREKKAFSLPDNSLPNLPA